MDDDLERVARALAQAQRILVITGAGLSADSGLPTYRGVGGLYEDRDTEFGMPIEDVLSGATFASRPELTWKALRQVEEACRGAAPNVGHEAIAQLERYTDVVVLTQNVDGFHRSAGSSRVIEIHGNLHRLRCTVCPWIDTVDDYASLPALPTCERCSGAVRPAVVLFGEMLPDAAFSALQDELVRGFDVVLSVGTTSGFPYIAHPVIAVTHRGGTAVEINPGETGVSHAVDVKLPTTAAQALPSLLDRVAALRPLA